MLAFGLACSLRHHRCGDDGGAYMAATPVLVGERWEMMEPSLWVAMMRARCKIDLRAGRGDWR